MREGVMEALCEESDGGVRREGDGGVKLKMG